MPPWLGPPSGCGSYSRERSSSALSDKGGEGMESSQPRFLLSVAETARPLNLSRKKLWEVTVPRGDLPCLRVGTRVLYAIDDLRAWIERQKLRRQAVTVDELGEQGNYNCL